MLAHIFLSESRPASMIKNEAEYSYGKPHRTNQLCIGFVKKRSLPPPTICLMDHAMLSYLYILKYFIEKDYEAGTAPIASCDKGDSPAGFSVSGTSSTLSGSPLIPSTTLSPSASCTN
jgi:hypothetical protein